MQYYANLILFLIGKGYSKGVSRATEWLYHEANSEMWVGWRARALNLMYEDKSNAVESLASAVKNIPELAVSLLQDVSQAALENLNQENTGSRNIGRFLELLSSTLTKDFLSNLAIILSILDCESYALRNSVVISIGNLLESLIKAD